MSKELDRSVWSNRMPMFFFIDICKHTCTVARCFTDTESQGRSSHVRGPV
jgi:hypothetical protein